MSKTAMLRAAARAGTDISSAQTPDEAAQGALAIAETLGFHSLSVVEKPSDEAAANDAILFTNVPETQAAKYRTRNYAAIDPIVQRTLRGGAPRLLSGIGEERLSDLERKVFGSYHCASGVKDGLVVPVRRSVHPDGVITFGGVDPDLSAPAQAALTVLGHIVYGRLEELRAAPCAPSKPALSPREIEVLSWVAKGKPDAEIAVILGMSERTARFHMANAKVKLGASTRVQAVTKALELGLIEG
jgi:DNA-binding CsgD family transcriptional regulator